MKKIILALGIFFTIANSIAQNKAQSNLNIMTFNIRYDNPGDGTNSWPNRKENALKMIRFNEVDILGMQEVLAHQLKDITANLTEYATVGVGREDGKEKGEFSPILYNKNKFTLIKSGYFWLSQTTEKPSKGWDAACERIATWVQLKDKATGKKIFVLNTHFDHIGEVARRESVNLIRIKIAQLSEGMPQIMMGDLNATPDSSVIQSLLTADKSLSLLDSKKLASIVYGPNWSYHDFGKVSFKDRPLIDYILVTKGITVRKYGVLAETLNDLFLSDHAPVFINVTF
ncbi:endonuclease/exonuclease/phosphatase family protein [Flavobacterium granuli]|uniref:Endonuclease/exonuclease/phosphatase family metal-dependent hydrolase n=1 Tax=Flavobacterium granuli TaxID=280093 RepID=A0ABU1S3B5_9FLAO|nr:endonuclease/exonuclease/phosphatase family protein [Flavobacterium granuli]MDR6844700.1 endonuclease/exonuclease/phosphatase family metal-dependent hydrolase [Flavobacterium granuli]